MINIFHMTVLALLLYEGVTANSLFNSFGEDENVWYKAGELSDRLKGEKWTIDIIKDEIDRLKMVADDLNDIRIYPSSVTNIDDHKQEKINSVILKVIKKSNSYAGDLENLRVPLSDAIIISIEMVKEYPNHDMIQILMQENIKRIQILVKIKKSVDKLWDTLSDIMDNLEEYTGIEKSPDDRAFFESQFLKFHIKQTGQSSDIFYKRYHDYKDKLAERLSGKEAVRVSWIEFARIRKRIKTKKDLRKNQNDLIRLASRYAGKAPVTGMYFSLGNLYMAEGSYNKAIQAYYRTKENSGYWSQGALGIMQAMFAQEKNDSLISFYGKLSQNRILKEKEIFKAKYLYSQAVYAMEDDDELERMALSYNSQMPYYWEIYFLYAKSLIRQNQDGKAGEVLKSIIGRAQLPESMHRESVITLAYLKFEQEQYEDALADFKSIINQGTAYQVEALFGTVWCYVKMRNIKYAETVLKKLINQFPDSPLAVEGIAMLGKWRFIQAMKLWDYKQATVKNRLKLQNYKLRFSKMIENQELTEEYRQEIGEKLSEAEADNDSRWDVSYEMINEYFLRAFRYLEYLERYYQSNEYSLVSYKDTRNRILQVLRGLLNSETGDTLKNQAYKDDLKLKVYACRVLHLDMLAAYRTRLFDTFDHAAGMAETAIAIADTSKPTRKRADRIYTRNEINEKISELNEICYNLAVNLFNSNISAEYKEKVLFYKGYFELEKEKMKNKLEKRLSENLNIIQHSIPGSGENFDMFDDNSFEISWEKLLRDYPQSSFAPVTMYYLGTAKIQQGSPEGAVLLENFLNEFAGQEYSEHAALELGDYYFSTDNMNEAMKYYSYLTNNPESKYFLNALYKKSWVYYKIGEYKKSMKAFSYILEHEADSAEFVNNFALTEEALKLISFNFAKQNTDEDAGDLKVREIIRKFKRPKMAADVMHKMSLIFRERGNVNKAERLLGRVRKNFPNYANMPQVLMDLAVIYDIDNKFEKAMKIRKMVFEHYNRDSEWYVKNANGGYRQKADSLCESALNKVALYYFTEAKYNAASGNISRLDSIYDYNAFYKAIKAYEKFLSVYPNTKNAGKLYYQLAESYFTCGEFLKAAETYLKASRSQDKTINSAASFNAVIAAQKAIGKLKND